MNKVILFIAILVFFSSCKDDKKPARLIEKDVMINIMYDLSILQAIKYQSPASIDSFKINARDYVYKKYKVDSLQFAKSNVYYSTDSEEYKKMFTQVTKRISTQKATSDSLIKVESKKSLNIKKTKNKRLLLTEEDTILKRKKKFINKEAVSKTSLRKEPLQ